MRHHAIVMLTCLATVPGLASAVAVPLDAEGATDLLPGGAEAATHLVEFRVWCRYGNTELGAEELYARWFYDFQQDGGNWDEGCNGIETLSQTKDTTIAGATINLFESDSFTHDTIDVGGSGTCGFSVGFNYASNTFTVGGSTIATGTYTSVTGSGSDSCATLIGTITFTFSW